MKLFNILFLAVKQSEFNFLEYRHSIDSHVYLNMKSFSVTHLKLIEPGVKHQNKQDELFFEGKNKFFYVPFKLCLFIKKEKPGVIIIHGFMFPVQLLTLQLFKAKNTKLIIQHHAEKPYNNTIKRMFQKLAYARADAYLFASKELADPYLNAGIIKDKQKIYEVMEGSALFNAKDKIQAKIYLNIKEAVIFLWVGRLDANKDPMTVIKALHKFKEAGNLFKLYMIYGTNELEKEVKNYIALHSLQDFISMLGEVPHLEIENWYNASDFFIAGSYYEGSGIALCEAMACGCIPIVTRIPSFIKMTDNGNIGLLFEPGNEEELLANLMRLRNLNKKEMSDTSVAHFNKELSLKAIGGKIDAIANSLLQQ